VSDQRISIAELRAEAAALQPDKTRFTAGQVLALVEAVEAAHQNWTYIAKGKGEPDDKRLDAALARFSFGDTA
jgi:hypothetical protein